MFIFAFLDPSPPLRILLMKTGFYPPLYQYRISPKSEIADGSSLNGRNGLRTRRITGGDGGEALPMSASALSHRIMKHQLLLPALADCRPSPLRVIKQHHTPAMLLLVAQIIRASPETLGSTSNSSGGSLGFSHQNRGSTPCSAKIVCRLWEKNITWVDIFEEIHSLWILEACFSSLVVKSVLFFCIGALLLRLISFLWTAKSLEPFKKPFLSSLLDLLIPTETFLPDVNVIEIAISFFKPQKTKLPFTNFTAPIPGGSAVWNRNQIRILNVLIEEQMLILRNIFNTIYCQEGTENVIELWYLQARRCKTCSAFVRGGFKQNGYEVQLLSSVSTSKD
ncbi:unnamed protein product [Lactuca virosa]|uniref:Reticulon-like protein n=1 Tax=Lactuca virosa TaxID=75947 RepID=A0AAU9PKE7_9ASTR|nr:unnamed protein product [Lactuca virosa]